MSVPMPQIPPSSPPPAGPRPGARVAMLLSNAFRPDPRVAREAQALAATGHQVTIVCWDREGSLPASETVDGYRVERVQDVRSVYGAGPRQLLYIPRFWREAVRRVRTLRPDVLHCHDLDTLPAGWWLKGRCPVRLVYDAHEDYPALMSLYLPRPMVAALAWLERRLLQRVDSVITASTVLADKLRSWGVDPVVTIGNVQPLEAFAAVGEAQTAAARAALGLAPEDLVVAYIGGFSRNRQLLPLIEAARQMPGVQVLLWGDGHQRAAVEAAAAQVPNVRYLGWLPAEQVPLHMCLADVVYYCLVPDYPGAVYNAPNTLSNAMAAGRPIVANDVGDLGRIVRQTGCGVLVPEVTREAIRGAIELLRDLETRRRMGRAGRAAAEAEYNWSAAQGQLDKVYAELWP
ncbi:MAG: glycosyltransferase family 4 protein [Anaerolineae bacterium]|nr:glycosyltransferase family 4 protein [Anaerolineae bacterium]